MAKRRRLEANAARERILDAATERLKVVGPQALKLTELGAELGISHQAILHHFASRDGLVLEVVRRILDRLQAELAGGLMVLNDRERGTHALINRAFEVMVDQGYGRLLAWLALTYPGSHGDSTKRPLEGLAQLVHFVRERFSGRTVDPTDTKFTVVLLTYTILASSIFDHDVLAAVGLDADADTVHEFRSWLTKMIVRHLESDAIAPTK